MLAIVISFVRKAASSVADLWAFTDAVIQDMRQTRKQLEDQYGPLGF
jgi:hypothetical protein